VIKADIQFGNGSVHRCVGRIVNKESVPWRDESDVRAHVAHVNAKNPDLPQSVTLVRIITDA
jgi:hypothetical protein